MARQPADEFYIGYEGTMPAGVARVVRLAVWAAIAACLVSIGVVLAAQLALPAARFEYGHVQSYTGTIRLDPYPRLHVLEPGGVRPYWLVAPGKRGAGHLVADLDGRTVRLEGSLIERGRRRMLDVQPGSIEVVEGKAPSTHSRMLPVGEITLVGEIVDGKCFLGVMNPSEGAVHRDCAVACLRGGLPPMLRTVGRDGREALIVLVSSAGEPVGHVMARFAGRPVEITGVLSRLDGDDVLSINSIALR
jgi:hypothetical protein